MHFANVLEAASHYLFSLPVDMTVAIAPYILRVFALTLGFVVHTAKSAPPGFPASGNGLWYDKPGSNWVTELLPIGNGYIAGKHLHDFSVGELVVTSSWQQWFREERPKRSPN